MNKKDTHETNKDLERVKLELEISELRLSWWKKPRYLGIILPFLIGLTAIFLTFFTTLIDKKVANYKENIKIINVAKDSLQNQVNELDSLIESKDFKLSQLQLRFNKKDSLLHTIQDSSMAVQSQLDSVNEAFNHKVKQASNDSIRVILLEDRISSLNNGLSKAKESLIYLDRKLNDSINELTDFIFRLSYRHTIDPYDQLHEYHESPFDKFEVYARLNNLKPVRVKPGRNDIYASNIKKFEIYYDTSSDYQVPYSDSCEIYLIWYKEIIPEYSGSKYCDHYNNNLYTEIQINQNHKLAAGSYELGLRLTVHFGWDNNTYESYYVYFPFSLK